MTPAYSHFFSLLAQVTAKNVISISAQANGIVVGVPETYGATDWFVVCINEHVSDGYVSFEDALKWACPVCDEQRVSNLNLSDLTTRLQHLASTAQPKGDPTDSQSQGSFGRAS